jgi:hypothetical protein
MQKPLNTHSFRLLSLLRGIRQPLLTSRTNIIALLVLLLSALSIGSATAADFTSNLVYITGKTNGNTITPKAFYTPSTMGSNGVTIPFTRNSPLGTFNRSTDPNTKASDELYINGEANTTAGSDETIAPPSLFYRVYRQNGSVEDRGGFIPLQLTTLVGSPSGNAKWTSAITSINLLQYATTPGAYVLEVYFQATYTVAGAPGTPPTTGNVFDASPDFPYSTTFEQTVDDKLYVRSTWGPKTASGTIYKWSEKSNWSGGLVPDDATDVTIPRNANGAYPIIDAGQARVHDITISGSKVGNRVQKAALVQNGGDLYVYGNFQDPYGGYSQATGGVLYLSGTTTQVLDASSLISSPVILSNLRLTGTGTKVITSNILIKEALRFDTNNAGTIGLSGRLVTGNFYVDLGATGRIVDETKESFIDGTVISSRVVNNNEYNNFGNIGVSIITNRDNEAATSPGVTVVTRNNYIYNGTGTSESISRGFQFSPDRANIPQFDLEFKYLDTELNNIPVSNLRLFRSDNGDIPFEALGRSNSSAPNTFTKTGITGNLAALFTLGNSANPLPVTLISFTATPTAQGAALIRWNTASETNNKGFGIERQLGKGEAWQPVGYLATGNSANGGTYSYTDKSLTTAPYAAQAYYRLRQEDQDGKVSYSPVAVVSRSAMAASSELLLSPVPVTGSNISLTFAEAGQAGSEITITNTQGQRLFSQTTQASADVALSLPVERLSAGVYIVSVRVPGQAVRHARFVKL